jgi:glycosyltransferase involved in cell wall biosynthesis
VGLTVRRVLIVAYYFPPVGGIGSIRLASFASHLPQFGWEPTVLAPESTPHQSDPSIRFAESRVVRARSIEPALMLRGRRDAGAATPAAASNGSIQTSRSSVRSAIVSMAFPDAQIGWYPAAVAAARTLVDDEPFDAVFSSSYPVTAHVIARAVARRAGLPWVAEFRDPWSERFPTAAHRLAARRLERNIVRTADAVIVPSRAFAKHYGARWGVQVEGIPNGHDLDPSFADPDDGPAAGAEPIIAHVGTYYPGRQSLTTIWAAIAALRESGRKMTIRWVGEMSAQAHDELRAYGLLHSVQVTGLVAHHEALALLRSSTMLIASGELDRGPLGAGTTAAKLFEYLASGLPILYVCNLEADAAATLGAHPGCYVVQFGDADGAQRALQDGLKGERHRREVQDLSRTARSGDLARVLDNAAARSAARSAVRSAA